MLLIGFLGLACGSQAAQARVSLAAIDAKLDALLAAQSIDLDRRVELQMDFSDVTRCTRDRAYFRIFPDGTRDASEFVVPAGYTLVILEVSWISLDNPNNGFTANGAVRLTLSSKQTDGSLFRVFYLSPPFEITSATTNTVPGNSEALTMGAAVGEGRIVCASVGSSLQNTGRAHTLSQSYLRGILVPND